MRPAAVLEERTARRISPALFVGALLCFFFIFAGVSCNTSSARDALKSVASLGGSSSGVSSAELDRCINALQNVDVISYSGFSLAFGQAPGVLSTPPQACPQSSRLPSSGGVIPSGDQAKIGVQPLALTAFIAIVLALLVAALAFLRVLRGPLRAFLSTLLAMIAFAMVLLEQAHVQTAILDRINAQATTSGAPFSIASYFIIDNGIGYIVALVALGIAALYNAAVSFFGTDEQEIDSQAPPEAATPPPQMQPSG